jgi:hypothetical protein
MTGTPRWRSRTSAGSSSGVAGEQEEPDPVGAEHLGDAVEEHDRDGVPERVEQAFPDERADDAAAAAAQ